MSSGGNEPEGADRPPESPDDSQRGQHRRVRDVGTAFCQSGGQGRPNFEEHGCRQEFHSMVSRQGRGARIGLAGKVGEKLNGRLQRLERVLELSGDGNVDTQALKEFRLEELKRLRELMEPGRTYTVEELQEMLR